MQIAIQGELGSFHDEATRLFFPDANISLVSSPTFKGVFQKLQQNQVNFGVVAVENSLFGSIHETYDQLLRYQFPIIGEVNLPIHQQLVAHPGIELAEITEVYSHPAALDQCRNFLSQNLPIARRIEHADTAGAVADISRSNNRHQSAIASARASKLYDMEIVASDIEDETNNVTRFIVLSKTPQKIEKANKASLILITPHQPGALYQALGVFADNNANLTKLESRPIRKEPFRYQFIIDVEANQNQLITLTHQLEQLGSEVKLLGHYHSHTPA